MSAAYEWISPFDEIDRLERWARTAQDQGERRALEALRAGLHTRLAERLDYAVDRMAHEIAYKVVGPVLAKLPLYTNPNEAIDIITKAQRDAADPVVRGIVSRLNSKLRLYDSGPGDNPSALVLQAETIEPIRFAIATPVRS
jgi:hypothetical protein